MAGSQEFQRRSADLHLLWAGSPESYPRLLDDVRGAKNNQRHDQHGASDDLLFLRRDAGKAERVLNESKDQEGDQDAGHGAGPSKNIDASEDNGGYHGEFEPGGGI